MSARVNAKTSSNPRRISKKALAGATTAIIVAGASGYGIGVTTSQESQDVQQNNNTSTLNLKSAKRTLTGIAVRKKARRGVWL